jgi:hypothetical protein
MHLETFVSAGIHGDFIQGFKVEMIEGNFCDNQEYRASGRDMWDSIEKGSATIKSSSLPEYSNKV